MTTKDEMIQKALVASQEVNHDGTEFKLLYKHPKFLSGALYVIGFKEGERKCENYVFVRNGTVRVAKNTNHLVDLANQESEGGVLTRVIPEFANVSSIIALVLIAAICYIVLVKGSNDVPAILSTSLSTIIGFYFGTRATKHT